MYRPSDKEIDAVAKVMKDYLMPSGWQTAAVLALDAAAKARQPPPMKKRLDDEYLVKLMADIVGTVEATRQEQSHLWSLYTKELNATWVSNNSGASVTVGYCDDRPVCISLYTAVVKGHKVMFWEASSQVVDYLLIDQWLKLHTPDNRTDATNFHNIFPRKEIEDE